MNQYNNIYLDNLKKSIKIKFYESVKKFQNRKQLTQKI